MNRLLRFLLLSLSILSCDAIFYAREISGLVTDENNSPLPGAACVLYQLPDSTYQAGTITDDSGKFSFNALKDNDYLIVASFLGFEKGETTIAAGTDSAGTIRLRGKDTELQEVVITHKKPQLTISGGQLTYNVDDILKSPAVVSAHDLLKELPLVQCTDSRTLKLVGAPEGSVIYINSRPSEMTVDMLIDYLKSLPAKQVKNVEIIYTPDSSWETTVAVINVILRQPIDFSFNGMANASYGYTNRPAYSAGANVVASIPKFSFNLSYNISDTHASIDSETTIDHNVNGEIYDMDNTYHNTFKSWSHGLYGTVTYSPDQDNSIKLLYSGSFSPSNHYKEYYSYSYQDDAKNDYDYDDHTNTLGIRYNHKRKVFLDFTWTDYNYHSNAFKTFYPSGNSFITSVGQKATKYNSSARFNLPLPKNWQFGFGARWVRNTTETDLRNIINDNSENADNNYLTNQTEDLLTFYAGPSKNFLDGRLTFTAQLTGSYRKNDTDENFAVFPYVNSTWYINSDHILQASFTSGRVDPSHYQNSEFVNYRDAYEVAIGNPQLKSRYSYSGTLVYILKGKYVLSISDQYEKRPFINLPYFLPNRLLQVSQMQNINYSNNLSASVSIPGPNIKFFKPNLTANAEYLRATSDNWYGNSFEIDKFSWSADFIGQFTVNKKPYIYAYIQLGYYSDYWTYLERNKGAFYSNAYFGTSLLKDALSIQLAVGDIFNTQSDKKTTLCFNGSSKTLRYSDHSRGIRLSLYYSFGGFKQPETESIDTSGFGM